MQHGVRVAVLFCVVSTWAVGRAGTAPPTAATHPRAAGGGQAVHKDVAYELDQYPEDRTEARLERHVAPAIRGEAVTHIVAS